MHPDSKWARSLNTLDRGARVIKRNYHKKLSELTTWEKPHQFIVWKGSWFWLFTHFGAIKRELSQKAIWVNNMRKKLSELTTSQKVIWVNNMRKTSSIYGGMILPPLLPDKWKKLKSFQWKRNFLYGVCTLCQRLYLVLYSNLIMKKLKWFQ